MRCREARTSAMTPRRDSSDWRMASWLSRIVPSRASMAATLASASFTFCVVSISAALRRTRSVRMVSMSSAIRRRSVSEADSDVSSVLSSCRLLSMRLGRSGAPGVALSALAGGSESAQAQAPASPSASPKAQAGACRSAVQPKQAAREGTESRALNKVAEIAW